MSYTYCAFQNKDSSARTTHSDGHYTHKGYISQQTLSKFWHNTASDAVVGAMQKSLKRTQSDVVGAPLKFTGAVSSCNLLEVVEGLTPEYDTVRGPSPNDHIKANSELEHKINSKVTHAADETSTLIISGSLPSSYSLEAKAAQNFYPFLIVIRLFEGVPYVQ